MQRELMRKMQKMQEKLTASMGQMQEELETVTVEGTAGQGMVKATVNGHGMLMSIKIDPKAVDPEDVDMLEDLVLTAVKDAIEKSKSLSGDKMSKLTAGLPIPPGFF
ncbi:MAG: YbaB/EbfC family nucleoid-associated protein [Candidatus Eremiobacteraeota bacterium]|nr:YbaB/EbfC family nucleoid-associated protein [Candidatus Eremiobacteraeota bacterium]MCW5866514.1 YbaB/EbfC family nucleoid-associated protein [Candidatus Eremiobacteraeota bacterium]